MGRVSFHRQLKFVIGRQSLAELSTVPGGDGVLRSPVPRFPTAVVPRVTELTSAVSYPRPVLELRGVPVLRPVASVLRGLRERCVALRSVSALRRVSERSVASASSGVAYRGVACALQSPPRVELAPAVQVWRRAAAAKMSARIARRLARLAAGGTRQVLQ